MAVFNKRQVGYIKAIAGVGKHKSFIHKTWYGNLLQNGVELGPVVAGSTGPANSRVKLSGTTIFNKRMNIFSLLLHKRYLAVDASDAGDLINNWAFSASKATAGLTTATTNGSGTDGYAARMECLTCPMIAEAEDGKIDEDGNTTTVDSVTPTDHRVGTEFFLDKTTLKMRFTMPDFGEIKSNIHPHFEYRLIIFRNRKPVTCEGTDDEPSKFGRSYLNPQYDLFNGPVGRPIGFRGHRRRQDFDGDTEYRGLVRTGTGWTDTGGSALAEVGAAEEELTVDEWMTMPLNSADYVIAKDERFFLGTQHGKSHYECMHSFDWNQRGETTGDDLTNGLDESFNPNWQILIMGTSNDGVQPDLNMVFSATTTVESA